MSAAHIVVERLSHSYYREGTSVPALAGIDLTVGWGEFVSIVGPSGCGKSTLLRALGGLLTPTSGVVRIAGRPPDEAKRRKRLGFVFQDASLLPWRSVIENVRLPLEVNRRAGGESPQVLVQLVGLTPFQDFYPHQLSGGMAQRAALARALVHNPEVLLMDEPLGALDELTRAQMRYEILQVWEQSRKTVVFVTHSVPEAVLLSDRVVVLTPAPGRIAGVVAVDLPRPRDEAVETSAPFHSRVEQVRRLLRKGDASVPQSEHRA